MKFFESYKTFPTISISIEKYINSPGFFEGKMLKIMKISEALKRRVYTDAGEYFGDIEEANIDENRIAGWKIKVANNISGALGGAKGVIIPHNFVKAVGDIVIINKASLPSEGPTDHAEKGVELM